ncbi:helix-turn-helix domain-containing protein [Streptomyces sp. NBC_00557]|uniref:helix-turn-helix domain-containing protein n=1 Tax=Streptomyces sp. NBC_00557 TaxID=2975776 RepID=UPI002E7FD643|nr:helix-turn-helix transcriptional regulator [Streptomyces sp. NBC_00557]WUC34671.1 helix-turn-helix transcriptional regulator [Streptomyces sp. NBC_00557]
MRQPSAPPFNAPAARRLRAALGMGPEHVAYGLRASYGLPYATPDLVIAWERGTDTPSHPELTALAGVLWCSPGELLGRPQTLREHRVARAVAAEDVARAVGMDPRGYLRMEESGQWRGDERQSAALARVLDLALPGLVAVTGREAKLADLLRSAVTTRWQAYVRPVRRLVPLDAAVLQGVLQQLYDDYQGHMAATLSWGGGSTSASESGKEFLDRIVENFWTAVEGRTDRPA